MLVNYVRVENLEAYLACYMYNQKQNCEDRKTTNIKTIADCCTSESKKKTELRSTVAIIL